MDKPADGSLDRGGAELKVPEWIADRKGMSGLLRLLAGEIWSLQIAPKGMMRGGCFAKNSHLAEWLGSTESSIENMISDLKTKGFLEIISLKRSTGERVMRIVCPPSLSHPAVSKDLDVAHPAVSTCSPSGEVYREEHKGEYRTAEAVPPDGGDFLDAFGSAELFAEEIPELKIHHSSGLSGASSSAPRTAPANAGAKRSRPAGEFHLRAVEFLQLWNSLTGLKAAIIDAERIEMVEKKFVRSRTFREHAEAAVQKIGVSKYHTGQASSWRATLSWFLKPGQVHAIMEGDYSDHQRSNGNQQPKKKSMI